MSMREQIWFMIKPGEERKFVSTWPISEERERILREEGYSIFRIEFDMPENWDKSQGVIEAKRVEESVT